LPPGYVRVRRDLKATGGNREVPVIEQADSLNKPDKEMDGNKRGDANKAPNSAGLQKLGGGPATGNGQKNKGEDSGQGGECKAHPEGKTRAIWTDV